MSLIKASLARALESVLQQKPSLPDAVLGWARAYLSYAQTAMSSVSSLPANAAGNLGLLQGAFQSAFQARSAPGAAAAIAAGVMSFWSTIVWVGPSASGSTVVPGNVSLSATLAQLFANTNKQSEGDKANAFADAFDAGAKQVIVLDVLFAQPSPPVSGPIT
jgi:hypothetical protein